MIYRKAKGQPLTAEEVDGNFKELETKIATLTKDIQALPDERVERYNQQSIDAIYATIATLQERVKALEIKNG